MGTSAIRTNILASPFFWLLLAATAFICSGSPHPLNVLLHVAVTAGLTLFAFEVLPGPAAWIAAIVFAVHPLQSEAVASPAGTATLGAVFVCVLALLAWRCNWLVASVVFLSSGFVLDLTASAAFPLLILLFEWSGQRRRDFVLWYAVTGFVAFFALLQRYGVSVDYLLLQGVASLRLLSQLILPFGLSVWPEVRTAPLAAALAWGVLAILPVLVWRDARRRGPGAWLAGGLLLLLPACSLFPQAQPASDLRAYAAMVCFSVMLGLLFQGAQRLPLWACAAVLAGLTFTQVALWRDEPRLWAHAARMAPESAQAASGLARALERAGDSNGASREWHRAIEIDPCREEPYRALSRTGVSFVPPSGCKSR